MLGGLYLEGLIHGGAYFRNFTVCKHGEKVGNSLAEVKGKGNLTFGSVWGLTDAFYVLVL